MSTHTSSSETVGVRAVIAGQANDAALIARSQGHQLAHAEQPIVPARTQCEECTGPVQNGRCLTCGKQPNIGCC